MINGVAEATGRLEKVMEKREELYAGKAKSVYRTDDPERFVLVFRDDTSAFDGEKKEQLKPSAQQFDHILQGGVCEHLYALYN